MARPRLPFYKKKYLIDKPNQLKFMLFVILYLLLYSVLVSFIIFFPSIKVLFSKTAPLAAHFEAGQEFLVLASRIGPAAIISIIIFSLHSIFMTHKVFGPLYRLKMIFRSMAKGELPTNIKLRKSDYIIDWAEELNKCNFAINAITGKEWTHPPPKMMPI